MAIKSLSDSLPSNDEHSVAQQAAAAAETDATRLRMEDVRQLAEVMKGKLYLTDQELREAMAREAEDAGKAKPGERRTAATRDGAAARDGTTTTTQDDVSARDITETARPTSVGVEPEGQRREAVTPVISGIGAVAAAVALGDEGEKTAGRSGSDRRSRLISGNPNDIDPYSLPIEANTPMSGRDGDRALIQQMLDHARVARAGDRGDQAAADRVIAAIGSGASLASVMQQYSYLQNAEKVADVDMTLHGRRGRSVHYTKIDDGDGSPDTSIEYSGSDSSIGEGGMTGGRRGARSGMMASSVAMGALLGGGDNRTMRQLISGGMDMPGANPFALVASQTPAQERERDQGLFLG